MILSNHIGWLKLCGIFAQAQESIRVIISIVKKKNADTIICTEKSYHAIRPVIMHRLVVWYASRQKYGALCFINSGNTKQT